MTERTEPFAPSGFLSSGDVKLALYRWPSPQVDRAVVLLLHGYPDHAGIWAQVAPALAAAHPVVAYDVRGAGQSSRPPDLEAYRMPRLLDDLLRVIDDISPDRPVHLVGHDFGSIQGWAALGDERFRTRIASFTSISGPGLQQAGAWLRRCARNPRAWPTLCMQALRSWYVAFYQVPVVPPLLWRVLFGRLWPHYLRWVEGVHRPPVNLTQAEDGACGVALYRANIPTVFTQGSIERPDTPVQLIVLRQDHYLSPALWEELPHWGTRTWRRDVRTSHWLPLTQPTQLATWVRRFIAFLEGAAAPDGLRHVTLPTTKAPRAP